jgi:hypothetical protein
MHADNHEFNLTRWASEQEHVLPALTLLSACRESAEDDYDHQDHQDNKDDDDALLPVPSVRQIKINQTRAAAEQSSVEVGLLTKTEMYFGRLYMQPCLVFKLFKQYERRIDEHGRLVSMSHYRLDAATAQLKRDFCNLVRLFSLFTLYQHAHTYAGLLP